MSYTLYGYWRSSSSWRVRIALHLKGLTFEHVPVHLVRGEHRERDHAARNPMQQVPVLVVDGVSISQSLAIIALLDDRHPHPPLLPAAPLNRARAWEYAELINAGIQPLQNLTVLQQIEALGGDRGAWARQAMAPGLEALEAKARATAGRCLVGDAVSLADLCLVPQLYNARRFQLDLSPYPTLVAVDAALAQEPAFIRAHPDQQPDAPGA